MSDQIVQKALELWGKTGADVSLAAHRENTVYKVFYKGDYFALRLHRPGYRSLGELRSELEWMEMLSSNGLQTPQPVASVDGLFCHEINGVIVDVLTWLTGETLTVQFQSAERGEIETSYTMIGEAMARLHDLSDSWSLPKQFERPSWDLEGLLGERPVWDRFWENPRLSKEQSSVFENTRQQSASLLASLSGQLDYGLIHADVIPDNVLMSNCAIHLIDFDDGGFGFRLFDLATTLNKMPDTPQRPKYEAAFLEGYKKTRDIDLTHLQFFKMLRALTYVGWIISRQDHPGSQKRSERFINDALFHISRCDALAA